MEIEFYKQDMTERIKNAWHAGIAKNISTEIASHEERPLCDVDDNVMRRQLPEKSKAMYAIRNRA